MTDPAQDRMNARATVSLIHATRSVAYEQRTANLLSLFIHIDNQGDMPGHAAELFNKVAGRLGIQEENDD